MSDSEVEEVSNSELIPDSSSQEKISPFQASYFASDPTKYIDVGKPRFYDPEPPALPEYCKTVLDCAVLFGNSSLAAMYGWRFPKSCEFWEAGVPLSESDRAKTLLNRKLKMIGLDSRQAALDYSLKMNIVDQGVLQNFEKEMSPETVAALQEADVWILQQCLSYMPLDNLKLWLHAFLHDRSRPKRFVYDFNPFFDSRDMTPHTLLQGVEGWALTAEKFYAYRQKTEEEYAQSQVNGHGMCVHHYVVDFKALEKEVV
jgi:hypothetical protein